MRKFCKHFTSFELAKNRVDETTSGEVKFAFFNIECHPFPPLTYNFAESTFSSTNYYEYSFDTQISLGWECQWGRRRWWRCGWSEYSSSTPPFLITIVNLAIYYVHARYEIPINNMCNQQTTRSWLGKQETFFNRQKIAFVEFEFEIENSFNSSNLRSTNLRIKIQLKILFHQIWLK